MDGIDIVAIGSMEAPERAAAMSKIFEQFMSMSEPEQISAFKTIIGGMAEKATDSQYRNLCLTNLQIAAGLPVTVLKSFLATRMKASSELPKNLSERDIKLMQEALGQSDPAVQEKITQNM
jgi:hypothetical protein